MNIKPLSAYSGDVLGVISGTGNRADSSQLNSQSATVPEDAVKFSISDKKTLGEIQKHLDDYKKGRSYLSSEVGSEIRSIDLRNGRSLGANEGLWYGSIRSFANYNNFSSLVYSTDSVVEAATKIKEAPQKAQEAVSLITAAFQR